MTNILIIGKNGQIANALIESFKLEKTGFNVLVKDSSELDFSRPNALKENLKNISPSINLIINCTGYTNVDKAEEELELCDNINHQAVKILADFCKEKNILLIHYSTDYVFDGNFSIPIGENEPQSPVNFYGETKAQAEIEILNNYKDLVMNIDCFMDITFSNTINEIKTFCKTNTHHTKIVVIDNFDIINESNQQYLKKWMDTCKNTIFMFGCENTNKINEIIQTRITPIYIEDLNIDNYRELIETISKKENIIIDNIDELLKYKNMTIYFIYNLFYKLKLLKITHVQNIIPYITLIDYTHFDNFFDLIHKQQLKNAIKILFELYDKGYSLIDIYHFMYEYIKASSHPNKYIIIEKLCLYIQYIYDGYDNKIMLMFFTNEIVQC